MGVEVNHTLTISTNNTSASQAELEALGKNLSRIQPGAEPVLLNWDGLQFDAWLEDFKLIEASVDEQVYHFGSGSPPLDWLAHLSSLYPTLHFHDYYASFDLDWASYATLSAGNLIARSGVHLEHRHFVKADEYQRFFEGIHHTGSTLTLTKRLTLPGVSDLDWLRDGVETDPYGVITVIIDRDRNVIMNAIC